MKIKRVYSGNDGVSHIDEVDFDLSAVNPDKTIEARVASNMVIIKENYPGFVSPWHAQVKRALIIQLEGECECEVGHGVKEIFRVGQIVLYEDKTGQGHRVRTVDNGRRLILIINLE